jgi:O-antigen/teichoic acid export membrane protein
MRPETRHSLVLTLGTGVTTAVALAYSVYAGRTLGKASYGDFVAILSLVALCHLSLGPINGTVARFSAQYASEGSLGRARTLWRYVTWRIAKYGLIAAVLAVLCAAPLTSWLRLSSVWSFVVGVGIVYVTLVLAVSRGALRGLQAFGSLSINTATESVVRLSAGVVLLGLWCQTESGLTAYLVALVAVVFLARAQLSRIWGGHAYESIDGTPIRRFAGPLLIMTVTSAALQNMDMLVAKRFLVETDAGLYAAAFTLSRMMGALVTPFSTLLLPLLTKLHGEGRRLAGTFARTCSYFLLLASVPITLFALWPEQIVTLLYEDEYAGAGVFLLPLTLTRLFGYLCHMIALAFVATNSFRFLWVYVGGLAVQLVLLLMWHESGEQIARVSLFTQGGTLAALALFQLGSGFGSAGNAPPTSGDAS